MQVGNCPGGYPNFATRALHLSAMLHTAVLLGNSSTLKNGVFIHQGATGLHLLLLVYQILPRRAPALFSFPTVMAFHEALQIEYPKT